MIPNLEQWSFNYNSSKFHWNTNVNTDPIGTVLHTQILWFHGILEANTLLQSFNFCKSSVTFGSHFSPPLFSITAYSPDGLSHSLSMFCGSGFCELHLFSFSVATCPWDTSFFLFLFLAEDIDMVSNKIKHWWSHLSNSGQFKEQFIFYELIHSFLLSLLVKAFWLLS